LADRDPQALRRQVEQRLKGTAPGGDPFDAWIAGLSPEQTAALRGHLPGDFARAAVMIPLVERPEGLTVLLTQRASHLKNHPGQISFPGGRIEPHDAGPWEAALRETREEIGLEPGFASLAGFLHDHMVLTGYLITPAVAFVRPGFALELDVTEVDDVFEVPLEFVLDPAHHVPRKRAFAGQEFLTHDIPYGDRQIWGATAGMLLSLYRLLRED
jgi:8-oxo-dGTP pyrophosphatase MutT (NUDIX family)